MENNVGDLDKYVRIAVGALTGLLSIAILIDVLPESLSLPEIASPVLGVVAIVLLATAFTGKCGVYSALGLDTR